MRSKIIQTSERLILLKRVRQRIRKIQIPLSEIITGDEGKYLRRIIYNESIVGCIVLLEIRSV